MKNSPGCLVDIGRPARAAAARPASRQRLIVCPPAGGGGQYARPLLREDVQLIGVRYPGREARLHDPFAATVAEIADEVVSALAPVLADDVPTIVLGNSLGAVVATQVAHRLTTAAPGRLAALALSGRSAPGTSGRAGAAPTPDPDSASDSELIDWLRHLDGLPEPLLADRAFLAMQLEILRADLRLSRQAAPMPNIADTALLLLCGADDPVTTLDRMQGWAPITTGPVTSVALAGAHHGLVSDPNGCHAALNLVLHPARI